MKQARSPKGGTERTNPPAAGSDRLTERFVRLPEEKRQTILAAGIRIFSRQAYSEAGTDAITSACGISKGLLFHYFGTKKAFYLHCLETALQRLVPERVKDEDREQSTGTASQEGSPETPSFYRLLFGVMDEKFRLCRQYPEEMRMLNLAARDAVQDIAQEKVALFSRYHQVTTAASEEILGRALACLRLKQPGNAAAAAALRLYLNALINRFLMMYRETPDLFFERADEVKAELRRDIDFFLFGICEEGIRKGDACGEGILP